MSKQKSPSTEDLLYCVSLAAATTQSGLEQYSREVSDRLFGSSTEASRKFYNTMIELQKASPDKANISKDPALLALAESMLIMASEPGSDVYENMLKRMSTEKSLFGESSFVSGQTSAAPELESIINGYMGEKSPTLDGLIDKLGVPKGPSYDLFKKQLSRPFNESLKSKNDKSLRQKLMLAGMVALFVVAQVATIAASVFGLGGVAGALVGAAASGIGMAISGEALIAQAKKVWGGKYSPDAKSLSNIKDIAESIDVSIRKVMKAEGIKPGDLAPKKKAPSQSAAAPKTTDPKRIATSQGRRTKHPTQRRGSR